MFDLKFLVSWTHFDTLNFVEYSFFSCSFCVFVYANANRFVKHDEQSLRHFFLLVCMYACLFAKKNSKSIKTQQRFKWVRKKNIQKVKKNKWNNSISYASVQKGFKIFKNNSFKLSYSCSFSICISNLTVCLVYVKFVCGKFVCIRKENMKFCFKCICMQK